MWTVVRTCTVFTNLKLPGYITRIDSYDLGKIDLEQILAIWLPFLQSHISKVPQRSVWSLFHDDHMLFLLKNNQLYRNLHFLKMSRRDSYDVVLITMWHFQSENIVHISPWCHQQIAKFGSVSWRSCHEILLGSSASRVLLKFPCISLKSRGHIFTIH